MGLKARAQSDLMGRDKRNEARAEHFAAMIRNTMNTPAWRALCHRVRKALYLWLKLEWAAGRKANNNADRSKASDRRRR